ncbi:hypothetical protein JCM13991_19360 [Thermodesulfovibrio hydrogeniphilus]
MNKIFRFVIWMCSKFSRSQIETIAFTLIDILLNRYPDIKLKDDLKEKYPNYRNFYVDPVMHPFGLNIFDVLNV